MFEDPALFFLNQLKGLDLSLNLVNIIEVIIVFMVLFLSYKRFIKGTQSEKLVKGIFILLLSWLLSEILIKLNLQIIGVFLKTLVSIVIFSLVVIFQPELRRFLGFLGQRGFLSKGRFGHSKNKNSEDSNIIKEVIDAVKHLSKSKCGALIVFQKDNETSNYSEVGTMLDAKVSCELILTIFHPNTPLHDGAITIANKRIKSAGVLLPLTEDPKLSWKYGTRHRAAIGMSEIADCACLVVSEETGEISISREGILKKYDDIMELKEDLTEILGLEPSPDLGRRPIFGFKERKVKESNNG